MPSKLIGSWNDIVQNYITSSFEQDRVTYLTCTGMTSPRSDSLSMLVLDAMEQTALCSSGHITRQPRPQKQTLLRLTNNVH